MISKAGSSFFGLDSSFGSSFLGSSFGASVFDCSYGARAELPLEAEQAVTSNQ